MPAAVPAPLHHGFRRGALCGQEAEQEIRDARQHPDSEATNSRVSAGLGNHALRVAVKPGTENAAIVGAIQEALQQRGD